MNITSNLHDGPPEPDVEEVGKALTTLKLEEVNIGNSVIKNIKESEKNSREYRKGIDFKIELSDGITIPLKVKATCVAEKRFKKQGRMRPFQIPVIVARYGCHKANSILHQLVCLLRSVVSLFKRLHNKVIHSERNKKHGGRIVHSFARA